MISYAPVISYVPVISYLAFGINRKAWGGELMLNFINCRVDHPALSYSHLYGVKFNPSLGIVIEFSDHLVIIRGRGLADIRKVAHARVVFIAEADRATAALMPDGDELRIENKGRDRVEPGS